MGNRNRCGIYMIIYKVTISKGQDNDHLFEKKRKKAQPSTEVLNTRFALFQSADVMKKKSILHFSETSPKLL